MDPRRLTAATIKEAPRAMAKTETTARLLQRRSEPTRILRFISLISIPPQRPHRLQPGSLPHRDKRAQESHTDGSDQGNRKDHSLKRKGKIETGHGKFLLSKHRDKGPGESHAEGSGKGNQKDHSLKRKGKIETGHGKGPGGKKLGKDKSNQITEDSRDKSANPRLKKKQQADLLSLRSQCLHQTDLRTPFIDGRDHGGHHGKGGYQKGDNNNQDNSELHLSEKGPFGLAYLADSIRFSIGDGLFDLMDDRA